MNRAAKTRKEVLRSLRGASGPLSTHEIAQQAGMNASVIREHLRVLEAEGLTRRVLHLGARGNAVRWALVTECPPRAAVMTFLDNLEAAMETSQPFKDLAGLTATRKLISHLEERLALSQGAQPLFSLGEIE
jgi:hypothetical protein